MSEHMATVFAFKELTVWWERSTGPPMGTSKGLMEPREWEDSGGHAKLGPVDE